MLFVIEAGLESTVEGLCGLMELFAGGRLFVEVECVEFFEQE